MRCPQCGGSRGYHGCIGKAGKTFRETNCCLGCLLCGGRKIMGLCGSLRVCEADEWYILKKPVLTPEFRERKASCM